MEKQPFWRRRGLRWGTASVIYALVVVAVLVIVNALGSRYQATWDLTSNHQYTLSTATRQILGQIKEPVHITAFLQSGSTLAGQLTPLLQEYVQEGHGRVTVQTVDPASHPTLARQDNVIEYNTIVVKAGKGSASATPGDFYTVSNTGAQVFNGESAITNAIVRAANPSQPKLYFLTGDGEHGLGSDYVTIGESLAAQGYKTASLNLLQTPSVPKDAGGVVIAGPQHDLSPAAVTALKAYAQRGGHLVVLLDPSLKGPMPNLYGLLQSWGVIVHNDVVVDPSRHYSTSDTVPVPVYGTSPITQPLNSANELAVFPDSVSLGIAKNPPFQVTPFLKTDSSAWGHTDLQSQSLSYDAAKDIKGPLNMGVSVESLAKGSTGAKQTTQGFRAVVFGSSTFVQDQIVTITQGNPDLFLNAVGWVTLRTQGVEIRPKTAAPTQLFLTGSETRGLFYGFVIILPLVALIVGAAVWQTRKAL